MRLLLAGISLFATSSAYAQQIDPALDWRVFADVNYLESERSVAEGFREGQLVGHVAAGLTDRITFFAEVSATPANAGYSIEAERAILRYDVNDFLKLSVGRYHTPVSYWNTAFHHGQWLQTSIARPDMLRSSGFVPLHFLGLLAEGTVMPGPLAVGYTVGVGNGRHTNLRRAGDAGDANDSRALTAGTSLRLPAYTALQLGAAYYSDRVTLSAASDFDERIVSAYLAHDHRETPEFIAEYARVTHAPRGPAAPASTTTSHAWYGQLAHRLPGAADRVKPYLRLERTRAPAADSLFAPLELNYDGATAGVRYDLAPVAALKLECRAERVQHARRMGTVAAQLSFTFPAVSERIHSEPVVAEPDEEWQEEPHATEHD